VALPPAVKNSAAVLRVEALSLEDFLNDFMRPGVPVVIEGAMEVCAGNVAPWPDPEYRTRQRVGGTLRCILY
jgi:hypothetical protein